MATIEELLKKLSAGKATFRDLQEYADLLGRDAGREVAKKILEDGLTEDEILALSLGLSRGNYDKISDYGDVITAAGYEAEGIHLKPVRPDFSKTDVRDALREISGKENATDDFIESRIALASQKAADRHMQANAEAANRAGLTALVSREYVSGSSGAHTTSKHPKVCAWCESRSTHGKMIPYPEAYAKGVFERHPNCKCIIDYISKRGEMTTQARAGDWQRAEGAQALKMRQRYGVDKNNSIR